MQTEIEESLHYGHEIVIQFYPTSHRYRLKGRKEYLLGVTTCTGILDKSRPLMIWASRLAKDYLMANLNSGSSEQTIEDACNQYNVKRDEAATKGSLVHQWIEDFIHGKNPPTPTDVNVKNGVLSFLKWKTENDVKFVESETRVYSKKYEYVGTADVIFTLGKEGHKVTHMGDWKTSAAVYFEMVMQVSAYQEAYTEEHGTVFGDKYILRLDKDTGNFESHKFAKEDHAEHFKGFLACLQLKELVKAWDKEFGYYAKK